MGSSDKPMGEQLRKFWEQQGEKRGVPHEVHDILNSEIAGLPVWSVVKLPGVEGQFPFLPYMASSHSHACNQIVTLYPCTEL